VSKRALIVHALFDILGGAEFLALNTARALMEAGFEVHILTATPIVPGRISGIFANNVLPNIIIRRVKRVEFLSKIKPGRLARFRRILVVNSYWGLLEEARKEYDLVIDTQSNLPTPVDMVYIHFPALIAYPKHELKGLLWKVYNWVVKVSARKYKIPRSSRILTNSTWTAHMIYEVHGVIADVVYPPVDIEYFNVVAGNDRREKLVVIISRFTPEKGLEKILDVARRLPDYTFTLVGSTGPGSDKVLEALKARRNELGLSNIEFKPDFPRSELRELLGRAMFYLHPEFPEHFGISIVEAMSAGVVPIVYRDGGGWYDIVSRVSESLGYNSIVDVPKIIRALEENKELYIRLREKSIEVSKLFNYESFKKNLLEKTEYIMRIKKLT